MEIPFEGGLLRPWEISDAEELALVADNKNIADNLRDLFPHPYSKDNAVQWLSTVLDQEGPKRYFAIIAEGKLAGSIGLTPKTDIYRKNAEVGYFIAQEFWGRGIASKALIAITAYAFRTFEIIRVYAEPFADNIGSRLVLEKAGYTLEATFKNYVIKNGVIKDSCIYSVLKENFKE
jgi:Acetyltransferases, including N-acetylases of ribosomal proteins